MSLSGSPGVEMVNVNIENCVVNPCVLRRGTNASIAFSFTTSEAYNSTILLHVMKVYIYM